VRDGLADQFELLYSKNCIDEASTAWHLRFVPRCDATVQPRRPRS
jgi:hypothetical protein